MYKKYGIEKLEKLKKKLGKGDIKSISSLPFPYITGEGKEEREHNCVLEYDSYLDEFLLIEVEKDDLLQDTKDLVIDNDLIDELLDQLETLNELLAKLNSLPCSEVSGLIEYNYSIRNNIVSFFTREEVSYKDEDENIQFDEFVHQTELSLDAREVPLRYLTNAGFSLSQVEHILLSLSEYQKSPIQVTFGNNTLLEISSKH